MTQQETREEFEAAKALLEKPKRILISGHLSPDGDSLGSMIALARLLRATGHDAVATAEAALYRSIELSGTPLATLPKGAAVHVFAYDERCAYVDFEGRRGFVALGHLKKTD